MDMDDMFAQSGDLSGAVEAGDIDAELDADLDALDCKAAAHVGGRPPTYGQVMAQGHSSRGATSIGMATGGGHDSGDGAKRRVTLSEFTEIKVIGKGSFGKVTLVRKKDTGVLYAMKVLTKENIIKRNQVEHTRTERHVLGYIKHPFIVGLVFAFQTKDKLFFVLDYCAGGELFFQLGKVGKFTEQRACFYAAQITLALEYIHALDVIYRDLKPENVLLDEHGNVRLTDFGLSKEGIQSNVEGAHSFCGTPEYLAPEILNRTGHGRAVDWWSLGALLYEMLTGLPPFYCRDRERLFDKIRRADLAYPKYLSAEAQSVLQGLLTRDPQKRLGTGPEDAELLKQHPFFRGIDFHDMLKHRCKPPWQPDITGSLDTTQFDSEFTNMPIHSPAIRESQLSGRDQTFAGFSFVDHSSLLPQHVGSLQQGSLQHPHQLAQGLGAVGALSSAAVAADPTAAQPQQPPLPPSVSLTLSDEGVSQGAQAPPTGSWR